MLFNMFAQQTVEAVAGVGFIFVGVMVYDALGLHYNPPPAPLPEVEPPPTLPQSNGHPVEPPTERMPTSA